MKGERPSVLQELMNELELDLRALGAAPGPEALETLAVAVYTSMGQANRQFHSLAHVFSFFGESDPVFRLAALFHDLIYLQVDGGWPPFLAEALEPFTEQARLDSRLRPDPVFAEHFDLLSLFGTQAGAPLPQPGANELLSALAFGRLVSGLLPRDPLLEVGACIEASIPFRIGAPGEALFERLTRLGLDPAAAETAVHRALAFANQDVIDFHLADGAQFLNNTWKLLPELNPALRQKQQYTLTSYRKALQAMDGFFHFLQPERIYHSWRGRPDSGTMKDWEAGAHRNLSLARDYLGAKLLAAGLLEALAQLSGGDAPLPLFMGDLNARAEGRARLEEALPPRRHPLKAWGALGELLGKGRRDDPGFDLKDSPLAAWILDGLEDQGFRRLRASADSFFKGELKAQDWLSQWPRDLVRPVVKALAAYVPSRRTRFEALKV